MPRSRHARASRAETMMRQAVTSARRREWPILVLALAGLALSLLVIGLMVAAMIA